MTTRWYFLCPLLCLACLNAAQAQRSVWKESKEKMQSMHVKAAQQEGKLRQWKDHILEWGADPDYSHALSVGARLNTNGWSGGIYYLHQAAPGRETLWQLHFSEIRQEKETKQENKGNAFPGLGKTTPYIFGKINQAYTLQIGYGRGQMLLPALLDGSMSVSFRYAAGPALALLKPYYLNLVYVEYHPEESVRMQTEKYSSANADHFLDPAYILGAAGWGKGLGETKLIPGAFAELAFIIEPDRPKAFVKTITIGGNAAWYARPLEIMADLKPYSYQVSFFVGLAVGKRWK